MQTRTAAAVRRVVITIARCGCAGSTCNCLINGGLYISVTGSGTINDPYVISSDGIDISDALAFIDTDTVDFVLGGSGTDTDPWQVRANATVAVADLTDVGCASPSNGQTLVWNSSQATWLCGKPTYKLDDLTDVTVPSPTANQVLAWNGTAWVPAAPVTAPVGSITVGDSMTGDGSVADPLEINIVTDDLQYQLEGAGTAADPLSSTLFVPNNSISPTAPITDFPVGIVRMYIGGDGQLDGWPRNYGTIIAIHTTTSNGWQWFYPYGQSQVFLRIWDSTNGWGSWLTVADPRQIQTDCGGVATAAGKTDDFSTAKVTFPSGLFTHVPGVLIAMRNGKPNIPMAPGDITPESFTAVIDRPSGDDTTFTWYAFSNYSNQE